MKPRDCTLLLAKNFPLWQRGSKGDFPLHRSEDFLDYGIQLQQNLAVVVTQHL